MRLKIVTVTGLVLIVTCQLLLAQQNPPGEEATTSNREQMPTWKSRGLPGNGHAALNSLVGNWNVQMSFYGTFGRDPNAPPIVADGLKCERKWVAGGRYIEDLTEGTVAGAGSYWRKGWLGYSNMDQRYEWVTIDAVNTNMMSYVAPRGSGDKKPISMSGVFTDQGVAGEQSVGKQVGMRTVISIDSVDRHIFELYFTPPGKPEMLATRAIYTRVKQ